MSQPHRIQLSRTKGWRMPPNSMNVARPSRWGNPFHARQLGILFPWNGGSCPIVTFRAPASLDRCLDLYVVHLRAMMQLDDDFLGPLKGKNLGCWCKLSDPCHADILLRLANPDGKLH